MKKIIKFLTISLLFIGEIFAQAPSCPTNSIYAHNGNSINSHTLPNGPLNTVLNNIPAGSGGLAVGPAFGFPAPNPTWWTTIGGNYWYYNNGGTWSNSGHSTGNGAAVNIGGGSTRLYNLVGATGQVYVYNGLGNGTLLTTLVPAFNGQGPYDIVCDMANNFYILKASPAAQQGIYCYNPSGVLTCSWSVTGMINQTAGGGFSILTTTNPAVHKMYYNSNGTDYVGNMIPGSSVITATAQALPGGSDYACCALPIPTGTIVAPLGGTLTCSLPQIPLVAQVLGNASLSWLGGYNTPTTTPVTPTCGGITWSGPGIVSGQGTATVQVNQPGVYSFTLNGCNGCPGYSITASFTVVGQAAVINPMITLSNTLTCFTPTAQLTTTPIPPGFTYTWTGPGITSTNTNTANINQPGTYTVAVSSNTSACAGTATILVPSNTVAPTLTITPNFTNICFGQSATINVSGANTYTWSNAQNGTSITVSPATTTQYSVTGTGTNGCTSTAVANVSVTPLPIPLPINNGPICIGGNLILNCSGGVTYTWSGPNSFTSSTQSNTITNVSMLNAGIYTVVATSGICSASATTNVVINALPTPSIVTNSPVCANQLLTLNGSGGNTYSWSGPGFSSNLQNPTIASAVVTNSGTYTLTVMDANGCVNSTTANVIVNPLPLVSASGSSVCSGANVTLTSNGGVSYSWSGPGGFTSSNQNPVITNASVNNSGNYVVTVTDANGCINAAIANVSVTPPYTINITNNSPVCQGYTLNLSAPLGYGYSWTGPNGFYSNLSSPYINNAQPSASGVYNLVVTDANGCTSSAITTATVNPNPILSIVSTNDRMCVPACITFTVNSTNTVGSVNWIFQNGSSSNTVTTQCFDRGGVYSSTATVVDNNGCVGAITNTIEVYPTPTADFIFSPIKPIEGNEVSFTDASHGANVNQWYWYFNSQNINSTLQNPYYVYGEAGTYPITLIVKSDKGCSDTITKIIVVGEDYGIYVPNTFTPNGDGLNDSFSAKGFGIVKFEMMIFDRWGEKLFYTNDIHNGWDGTIKGKLCKDDTYVWKITLTNVFGKSHELTGHVTLMK